MHNDNSISGQNYINPSCGIILLAAGASARLGKPKQLLRYEGMSLLQSAIKTAVNTSVKTIVLVLGANAAILRTDTDEEGIQVVVNSDWAKGMSSSIQCGLQELLKVSPMVQAAIIMVCDQPFVTIHLLESLLMRYQETGKPVIASKYGNSIGTPALFDKTIFALLLSLSGDKGAKSIIKKYPEWVDTVDFPLGYIDIDTDADYKAFIS